MNASIARRYARALLEVATDLSAADAIGAELETLARELAGSADLRDLLVNPAFSRDQRHAAFDAIVASQKLAPALVNLTKLLIDRSRANELPAIARLYRELSDERAGRARATVTTAVAISAGETQALAAALSKAVEREVMVDTNVDPSLLGGAVTQVGSFLFDGSIKGQLRQLRRELKRT